MRTAAVRERIMKMHSARRCQRLAIVLCCSAFVPLLSVPAADPDAESSRPGQNLDRRFEAEIRPILERHCLACHSGEGAKAKLQLDALSISPANDKSVRRWQIAARRVRDNEMPPADRPRPTPEEIGRLTDWIAEFTAGPAKDSGDSGRVVLRRLNRVEYENTLSDLLGVPLRIKDQLPADGSAHGFDNAASALHTSSFLMQLYLESAETALDLAIANLPQPPVIKERHDLRTERHITSTTEKVFRLLDDSLVFFSSSAWHQVHLWKFYPRDGGLYRFRISANAVQSHGQPVTYRVVVGGTQLNGKDGLIGYFDAPAENPEVVEFVHWMEPRTTIAILPYGLASAHEINKVGADAWEGPGLAVQWVDIEGPLYDSWPPESHRRLLGELRQVSAPIYNQSRRVEVASDDPLADADRLLASFIRRAYRREVSPADVQPFVEIVKERQAAGYSFEQALRAAFKGVLLSPDFLFLHETPGPLDDFALANRLSYFLWSSMPDEELLRLAAESKLSEPDVLHEQVERLLRHPKAAAFTENFVGQWLGLRDIDMTEPSHLLYPEYDHMLKVSMIREAELFFEEVLRENLSLANFISSDFSMLNGRLARHYGIDGPIGWTFTKTPLPADSRRGGVLTMAGVLKVTANGTTTSPVTRGAWVLDRLLGTPPSPPPPDVPLLEPDIRGATTVREQLARHRSVAACAGCHERIDPPGFALESFDCIGGWRDHYRVTGSGETVVVDGRRMPYHRGKPVDPTSVMPDGRELRNIDDLKAWLLEDRDRPARALAVRLVSYATGAAPTEDDGPELDAIIAKVRAQEYGFRSLVHAVVESRLFRHK